MQKRYYVGLNRSTNKRELIYTAYTPTQESYPDYFAVIGPLNTKQEALACRDYGGNYPNITYLRSKLS